MQIAQFAQSPETLLQALIRFDTSNPPGNESQCIGFIKELLTDAGMNSTILAKSPDRPNLLARMPGQGIAPPLLLYGHLDVVPVSGQNWVHPPFSGEIIDGTVWGRGAIDMKGGIAMMLAALLRLQQEGFTPAGDLIFLGLCDEEVGGAFGAQFIAENHADLLAGVHHAIGEFGGFNLDLQGKRFYPIQIAEKQGCGIVITTRGAAGHASLIATDGALAKAAEILQILNSRLFPVQITPPFREMILALAAGLPFPKDLLLRTLLVPTLANATLKLMDSQSRAVFSSLLRNTINPTIIQAGTAVNVIPEEVRIQTDVRLLPGESPEDFAALLRRRLPLDASVEIVYYSPNPARDVDMRLFGLLASILEETDPTGKPIPWFLPAVTDARFFNLLGIQTYGYTPMQLPPGTQFSDLIHAANERIPVSSVRFGTDAIYSVLHRYGQH